MTYPNTTSSVRQQESQRKILQRKRAQDAAISGVALEEPIIQPPPQPAISGILNIMEDINIKDPKSKRQVIDLQRYYETNKTSYLLTTMMLFLKNDILTPKSFHFLKNSINIIKHVFSLMHALAGTGLMNRDNLDSIISLPALTELNTMFTLLDEHQETPLTQTTFDQVLESATPITEGMVKGIEEDDDSKTVAEALIRCATNRITSEAVLQQVKSHPYPQRLASAFIDLKHKGIKLTQQMFDTLIDSETPEQLIDKVITGVQSELQKPAESSWVSSAASYVGKGLLSTLGFLAQPRSPSPEKVSREERQAPLVPDEEQLEGTSFTV